MSHVEIYKDSVGEWRWRAFADNGENIGNSSEGYKNRLHAVRMAEAIFPNTEITSSDWAHDEAPIGPDDEA